MDHIRVRKSSACAAILLTCTGFNELEISIATEVPQTEGYFVNGTGLQNAAAQDGWLACDWWYSAPQIFAVPAGYEGRALPSSCSKVNLIPVPAA